MIISIGKKTDVGCVREVNEDSYYVEIPQQVDAPSDGFSMLLVADGMGGQVGGKEASETAVDTIKAHFPKGVEPGEDIGDIEELIHSSFHRANQAVFEKGRTKNADMGTTLTAAFIRGETAYIGHVGDSRAYHIRGREIGQLTEDHTLAEDMVRKGKASREEVKDSPMRSMLTRSIGTGEEVTVDPPAQIDLQEGDVLLLCTDGLTNLVEEREMLSAIHNTPDVQAACDKLVDIARARGGHDNITVIAAEFGGLKRIRGLGIRAKTVSVKRLKRRRFLIASICILVAVLLFLAYLFGSYLRECWVYEPPLMQEETEY